MYSIKTCNCGYTGHAVKMAFDVPEAYIYLCTNKMVYTVRPLFSPPTYNRVNVHIHHAHQWTKQEATKLLMRSGAGQKMLSKVLSFYLEHSGFAFISECRIVL